MDTILLVMNWYRSNMYPPEKGTQVFQATTQVLQGLEMRSAKLSKFKIPLFHCWVAIFSAIKVLRFLILFF